MIDKLIKYILKESGVEKAINDIALSFIYNFEKRPPEVNVEKISQMFGVDGESVEEILTSLLSGLRKNDSGDVEKGGDVQES